jgi:UDP-glucuronate 4-epimerase
MDVSMRVMVTGGAGFIGSHLTRRLLIEGHEVLAIDSFSNYYSTDLKQLRVSELIAPLGGQLEKFDLSDISKIRASITRFKPDAIIHLAAQPGIRLQPRDYERYTRDNLLSFSNLLQVILESGINNFIFASSSSVYGNYSDSALKEDLENLNPISYYGGTKLANEIMARTTSEVPDFSAIGLRFFTVYGPYGRPDMAYFRLISQTLTQYEFELYGDGTVKRDFTFVGDTVEAICRLLLKQFSGELRGNSIFNIGGGKPASMLDMISEIESLSGKKISYKRLTAHSGDVRSTNANTEKLERVIGFVPQTGLRQGLNLTIEWACKPKIINRLEKWSKSVG